MEKYKLTPAEIEGLEKRGFDRDEIESAEIIVYRFEDWLVQKFREIDFKPGLIDAFYFNENGKPSKKGEGQLALYIYLPSELQKINQYKEDKLKAFETAYFEALVEIFEFQEKGSIERILLAESELGKVNDLIKDKFPKCTTGWIYSNLISEKIPTIWLKYRNDGGENTNLAYWFKKICVNGENRVKYVSHHHTTLSATDLNSHHPDDLHFVVSALAFHRFKGYLEAKLLVSEQSTPKRKITKVKDLPPFEDAVKEPGGLRDLWERLSEMERPFVNEFGGFIGLKSGRNVVKILALAQAIAGKIKPGYSQFDTYAMLCTLWDLPPSTRPEKALNQAAYLPTLTDIKDALA